ncbi:MAG: endonuclease III [Candidatus Gottesmanbacteria bacterium]
MNDQQKRITVVLQLLKKTYPHAHIMLNYKTPWELLVAVILSAQCTDIMVNKVTASLFMKYKTIEDVAHANQSIFEQDIKSIGFYRNKAKHIIAAANMILQTWKRAVPKTMEELITIPGVGRKTANVVLCNAYQTNAGIAVDTHVLRLSERLRLVSPVAYTNPIKTERELMNSISKSEWRNITYHLIDHGRAVCRAQKPKCDLCVLSKVCPSCFSCFTKKNMIGCESY